MDEPVRIQLSRRKGWRMPENTVKVDRATKWGNPYTKEMARRGGNCECNICIAAMFQSMLSEDGKRMIRAELKGKNLACWCGLNQDCHANVLLEIANHPNFACYEVA
jgi:hypothetical protein